MIQSRAWYWHKKTGTDIQDLIAAGNLAFAIAIKKYNPNKGAFSTLLWYKLNNHIGDYAKWQGARRSAGKSPINAKIYAEYCTVNTPTPENSFRFKTLIESLSEEAKEIIKIIFNCPDELLDLVKKKEKVKITKKAIKAYLIEQAMPSFIIDSAFSEITCALKK